MIHWWLWQARIVARLLRNPSPAGATKLIPYLDVAGGHGDPSQADALYGAPSITQDAWFGMPKDIEAGWPR